MSNLYFECTNGISGDMSVAALIDLGADKEKLEIALKSMNLDNEFSYEITDVKVNSIKATDFNVMMKHCHSHEHNEDNHVKHHHHEHRNLDDVIAVIDSANMTANAKTLAKKIFSVVAEAESKVHNLPLSDVHFHEVGAIDSIADIVAFSVLLDDINPEKIYFSTLTEGQGTVECQHGTMNVPVPAVCEIVAKYSLPIKITDNEGEMITPTGAAIVASLYTNEKLPDKINIIKIGVGAGKRKYKNPILRVMEIK